MAESASALVLLTRYNAWADSLLYASAATLSIAQLTAPTPIFAGSVLRTLNHVRLIGAVWQAHLMGVPHGFTTRNPGTSPALDVLRPAQERLDAWFVDVAASLSPAQREEVVRFAFIGGGEGAMTRGAILAHVVNHATYHRGHITAMLYQLGVKPPVTDLPVFTREHRQGARPGQPANKSDWAS